jgi:hypothetical protein
MPIEEVESGGDSGSSYEQEEEEEDHTPLMIKSEHLVLNLIYLPSYWDCILAMKRGNSQAK